jgi:hypothetical protein
MGYWASPLRETGSLYLDTKPFNQTSSCKSHYQINLISDRNNNKRAKGKFEIYFQGDHEISSTQILDDSYTVFEAMSNTEHLVTLDEPISKSLRSVYISYTKVSALDWILYESKWLFKEVRVLFGSQQTELKFCHKDKIFEVEKFSEYILC